MTADPIISVVIPTRDRPSSLARLLQCVREQDIERFECVVIDDGSNQETISAYDEIWRGLDDRFRVELKSPTERKSGPSVARNKGIGLARGQYVAFCDDDDRWVRPDHLRIAVEAMGRHKADMFFANLQGCHGEVIRDPDYYAPAKAMLTRNPASANGDVYVVAPASMTVALQRKIPHIDSFVAARQLLLDAGLFWERTTMGEDVDFGFRMADRATKILFRSTVVAELDVGPHDSLVRSFQRQESALFTILATLHAEAAMKQAVFRRAARRVRAWNLYEVAKAAADNGDYGVAREFCLQSQLLRPTASGMRLLAKVAFKSTS